jgi:hypothetical protein
MPKPDGRRSLAALFPVRAGMFSTAATRSTTHLEALKEALADLPTAMRSPATDWLGLNSPFSREPRTHFAHFALIGEAVDPSKRGHDACLLLTVEFEARSDDPDAAQDYLRGLWAVMEPELRKVLRHCEGFEDAEGREGFLRLVQTCLIETTPVEDNSPGSDLRRLNPSPRPLLGPLLVASAALVMGLLGVLAAAALGGDMSGWLLLALVGLVALPLAALLAWRSIPKDVLGAFPATPASEPESMRKALQLQQALARYMVLSKTEEAAVLRTADPTWPPAPRQPPGLHGGLPGGRTVSRP